MKVSEDPCPECGYPLGPLAAADGVHADCAARRAAGAKGYTVAGEEGLEQAWVRYLPGYVRNKRNQGNYAGQAVSHPKPVSLASETANSSETADCAPDLLEYGEVSPVSDVSHTSRFRSVDGGAA
ncbi:hypothetical protein [Nocardia farcinica]|uniref:hypothetical protein n=1 Tax=Nocardia farcinica TaxID=37329 RepID=UPI0012FF2F75|nr:hypothetical protein [Nocardia farcinica]